MRNINLDDCCNASVSSSPSSIQIVDDAVTLYKSQINFKEIKERLDLSWSECYNSIHSLKKLNLVKVFDDFDEEGSTKQFVILEERGRVEYTEFVKIVGKYVEFAKEFIPDYDGTDLYPYLKQKMSSIALLLFYKPIRISLN